MRAQITAQGEDRRLVRGWLTDAAFATTLLGITSNWAGVEGSLEELNLTNPVIPPGDPRAGAAFKWGYSQDPQKALSSDLLSGLPGVLTIFVAHQPDITGADPQAFVDTLIEAFRTQVKTEADAAGIVSHVGLPAARISGLGPNPVWRLLITLRT